MNNLFSYHWHTGISVSKKAKAGQNPSTRLTLSCHTRFV